MARKASVRFSTVHILEFRLSVGDSPFVSSGPPVRLGSRKVNETIESVDKYEQLKRWRPIRKHKALVLSKSARVESLLDAGYSKQMIYIATSEALKARRLIDESKTDPAEKSLKEHVNCLRRRFKNIATKSTRRLSRCESWHLRKGVCADGDTSDCSSSFAN